MEIKNVIKGIIIHEGKLLVIKHSEEVYLLPETVQEYQETMAKSLEDDCIEKFGILVDVEDILFIKEEIDDEFDSYNHLIEYYFVCSVLQEINKDANQDQIEWIDVNQIMDYHVCPLTIRPYILDYVNNNNEQVYLGEIE